MGVIGALVATGIVALSVASLSGAASAQTPGGEDARTRYQELLADKLGISVDKLTETQKAVRDQLVDEAVAAGKLTPEQGEKIKSGELGQLRGRLRDGMHGAREIVSNVFEAAAKVIGIDQAELKEGLSNGQSLAEIAAANGLTRDQLESGLTTELKARIAAALADGTIDQPAADRLLQALDERIDAVIDGTPREGLQDGFRKMRPLREGMRDPGMEFRFFGGN